MILAMNLLLLTKTISKIIKKEGIKRQELQNRFYRIVNESFGNFKIIKLLSNEKKIFDNFSEASYGFSKTNIINSTLSVLPRNILETFGFSILIGVVVYILFAYHDASFVIPIISMYALALYRMLPGLNRMLYSYNQILYLRTSLDIVHEDLMYKSEEEGNEKITFNYRIELKNITFSYDNKAEVLKNINLLINKGAKIAFVGESGSGKSTLVDLIIGIYKPQAGEIYVDDAILNASKIKNWRAKVGYIPQSIYLFDGTVGENVAFGHEFDENKIIETLKKANIYEFLQTKEGIDTKVGDGGIKLSGGQKQRIGIARALYHNPEILVLDEATSALDSDTETKIMEEIYNLTKDKTLLVIAHRLSTIQGCDTVYKVDNGEIRQEK
jgi:ATP-binding cassette subfamily B protein/ATP-binding cassette subfamily C protein